MDQRQTFSNAAELMNMINVLFTQQRKASFIIDQDGLTRTEGLIVKLEEKNGLIEETVVHLQPSLHFKLSQVIAVNGVFRSDYSEC